MQARAAARAAGPPVPPPPLPAGSTQEKIARASLKSALERVLDKHTHVILDSLNNIKARSVQGARRRAAAPRPHPRPPHTAPPCRPLPPGLPLRGVVCRTHGGNALLRGEGPAARVEQRRAAVRLRVRGQLRCAHSQTPPPLPAPQLHVDTPVDTCRQWNEARPEAERYAPHMCVHGRGKGHGCTRPRLPGMPPAWRCPPTRRRRPGHHPSPPPARACHGQL